MQYLLQSIINMKNRARELIQQAEIVEKAEDTQASQLPPGPPPRPTRAPQLPGATRSSLPLIIAETGGRCSLPMRSHTQHVISNAVPLRRCLYHCTLFGHSRPRVSSHWHVAPQSQCRCRRSTCLVLCSRLVSKGTSNGSNKPAKRSLSHPQSLVRC